jgi:beta-phosphoglucomutase
MSELRAVVFDLDGVLILTEDYHFQTWSIVAGQLGIACERDYYDRRLRGLGRHNALTLLLNNANLTLSPTEFNQILLTKNQLFLDLITARPLPAVEGAEALVNSLKSDGIRVAVGSSSRNARELLQQTHMLRAFDVVVDGNDAPAKPDPAVFQRVAQLLEVAPSECVVVEDAEVGIRSAQRAGMPVVAVASPGQFSTQVPTVTEMAAITKDWLRHAHRRAVEGMRAAGEP